MSWESNLLGIIKTKKEGITLIVIHCYAPTNDSNDDDKDQFYERPQSIVKKCSGKVLTILMEDLNTKVGMDNTEYEISWDDIDTLGVSY